MSRGQDGYLCIILEMNLSDRLRRAMEIRGLAVSDLLSRVGVSKSSLYFLLDGTTRADKVRYVTVADISKALKISPEWLVYGSGSMDAVSQSVQLDADTIEDAQQALSAVARIQGLSQTKAQAFISIPSNLAVAINAVLEVASGGGTGDGRIIDFMARIADKMRTGSIDETQRGTDADSNSDARTATSAAGE